MTQLFVFETMEEEQFEIRDIRNADWYWVQKSILEYRGFKSSDKLIYSALCYFANQKNQKCFPSTKTIMRLANLSQPTVLASLRRLEENKVIHIERREGKISIYTLLKTYHLKNLSTKNADRPLKNNDKPLKKAIPNNNYNKNKEQSIPKGITIEPYKERNKDIDLIIETFKKDFELTILDGSVKQNRQYAWLLLKKVGKIEPILVLIKFASKHQWWGSGKLASLKDLYYNIVKIGVELKNYKPKMAIIRK